MRAELSLTETGKLEGQVWEAGDPGDLSHLCLLQWQADSLSLSHQGGSMR